MQKQRLRRMCDRLCVLAFFILHSAFCLPARAQCSIDWFTLDAGVGTSTSALCSLTATIGQPDAGRCASADCVLEGGFWGLLGPAVVQVPGAPRLAIAHTGPAAVTLSWPAPAPGWVLQENWSLPKGQWYTVITPLAEAAGRIQSLEPAAFGNKFYRLSQVAAAPALSVQSTTTNTLVSWTAPASGWVLERCPASGAGLWTLVSAPATLAGGQLQVSLPATAANDFYRLVLAPVLTIVGSPTNTVIISWPAPAPGWVLLECASLQAAVWSAVTNTPVQVDVNLQVVLPQKAGATFYRLAQAIGPPQLSITQGAGNSVVLAWPASAASWTLEESATLSAGSWSTVTNAPVPVGGNVQIILSPVSAQKFYRLKQP